MAKAVVFEASRTGYGIDQIKNPMTVGELISILSDYDEDDIFILSHDKGYTYGSIEEYSMQEYEKDADGEWVSAEEDY